MPTAKEPDILHRAKTVEDAHGLYATHFDGASAGQLRGEGSTYYTMLPTFSDVTMLARNVCGKDLKLIYLMRDPIKRITSHLAHDYMVGRLQEPDFDRAVNDDPRYVSWSDYPMQAKPWLEHFGPDSILFLSFESYVSNRVETLSLVFSHLGLDPREAAISKSVSNERGSQRQLRFSGIEKALKSKFYQNSVRTVLPTSTLALLKRILMRKRALPAVTLSHETLAWLEARFAGQAAELDALGIQAQPGIAN